jgi:hypothetical protein
MVDYIKRLYVWFKRPWPLHLLPIFIGIHLVGLVVLSKNTDSWNLFSSTFLQLYGGWFVIKTISDNLNILSSSSILASVRGYIKSRPSYKPKSVTAQVKSVSLVLSASSADAIAGKKLKTTKEKIEFLFSEIKRLEGENRKLRVELVSKNDNLKSSLDDSIRNQKKDIENVQSKIADTLVGGAKEEALGILCIFYSLLIPYITLLMRYLLRI